MHLFVHKCPQNSESIYFTSNRQMHEPFAWSELQHKQTISSCDIINTAVCYRNDWWKTVMSSFTKPHGFRNHIVFLPWNMKGVINKRTYKLLFYIQWKSKVTMRFSVNNLNFTWRTWVLCFSHKVIKWLETEHTSQMQYLNYFYVSLEPDSVWSLSTFIVQKRTARTIC